MALLEGHLSSSFLREKSGIDPRAACSGLALPEAKKWTLRSQKRVKPLGVDYVNTVVAC